MLIEFLIATIDRKDLGFLDSIFSEIEGSDYSVLVINQCINIPLTEIKSDAANIRCKSIKQKGLSNSRNEAIKNATGDICMICDDDVVLEPDILQTIRKAYNEIQSDVITFKIITPGGTPYKSYPSGNKLIRSGLALMQISSIEITFKRTGILENNIWFNENIGLGTEVNSGEEICFLKDCINRKLKINFYDKFIVRHPKESSGKNYEDKGNAKASGAIYKKLFPVSFIVWILYFSIKRWPVYRRKHSLLTYINFMLDGSRMIKNVS